MGQDYLITQNKHKQTIELKTIKEPAFSDFDSTSSPSQRVKHRAALLVVASAGAAAFAITLVLMCDLSVVCLGAVSTSLHFCSRVCHEPPTSRLGARSTLPQPRGLCCADL